MHQRPAAAPKAVIKGDAVAGKTVYESNCSACHQKDGAGMGGALGADFVNDPTRKAKSDAELFASIRDGVPNTTMIAWGALLKDQERADALAYIRTTFMN
jgi:cytochrome c oxidase cbb3-type subunit III